MADPIENPDIVPQETEEQEQPEIVMAEGEHETPAENAGGDGEGESNESNGVIEEGDDEENENTIKEVIKYDNKLLVIAAINQACIY